MREEKEKLMKALHEANKIKTAEDIKREVQEEAANRKQQVEQDLADKIGEEKRIRAEKAALNNSKWSGGSVVSPGKPLSTVNKNNNLPLRS
jgi:hypothetical protein